MSSLLVVAYALPSPAEVQIHSGNAMLDIDEGLFARAGGNPPNCPGVMIYRTNVAGLFKIAILGIA